MKLESIMYSIQFNLTQFIMLKAGIKTLPCTKCDHKQNLLCNLRDFIDKMLRLKLHFENEKFPKCSEPLFWDETLLQEKKK